MSYGSQMTILEQDTNSDFLPLLTFEKGGIVKYGNTWFLMVIYAQMVHQCHESHDSHFHFTLLGLVSFSFSLSLTTTTRHSFFPLQIDRDSPTQQLTDS